MIEDQVTRPLTTSMLSVPGAKTVRGFQCLVTLMCMCCLRMAPISTGRDPGAGIFKPVQAQFPPGVKVSLGPDATGVGWIYEYALIDRSGKHSPADLRALQDWTLKFELKTVPNVSEVASIGGMVRQYQIVADPAKMRALNITHSQLSGAVQAANKESGGALLEMGEAEYMVRTTGYLRSLEDFRNVVIATRDGVPVLLKDVATIGIGPEIRRGVAELNGEGRLLAA